MNLIQKISVLTVACTGFAISAKSLNQSGLTSGKAWVAITYSMAENGASNKKTAAVGAFGVLHGAMEGAIYGAVFGGPAGVAAGIVWGM